jgi:hypothetical protein
MYGNADYDVRHNFSANYVYNSPKMHGLFGILGDWTVGGTLSGILDSVTVVDTGTGGLLNASATPETQAGAGAAIDVC